MGALMAVVGSSWRSVAQGVQSGGRRVKDRAYHAVDQMLGIASPPDALSDRSDSFCPEHNIKGLGAPPPPAFPRVNEGGQDHNRRPGSDPKVVRTECIFVGVDQGPNSLIRPMARLADSMIEEQQQLEESLRLDNEAPAYEVDLISALESYLENPNECFSHLVAAALASRSARRPVTGTEVAAAQRNPFLVRLIADSGCLDVDDPLAQQQVQETLDALIPLDTSEMPHAVYEYLKSFLRMPFVRLSHEQYALLKESGFDYIYLMRKYRHVLPRDKFHSILLNYSRKMLFLNQIFMILSLIVNTLAILAVFQIILLWFTTGKDIYQINGIYSLVVYGCGYIANLVTMVYITQRKDDASSYEDTGTMQPPSLYVLLLFFPIYEVFCLITFVRALKRDKLFLTHNILALSRTAGMCIAMWFVIPQILTQRYIIRSFEYAEIYRRLHVSYNALAFVGITQWSLAFFRYGYMMITYDSINNFGFASFNKLRMKSYIERHLAIPILLNHFASYVSEVAVYMAIVSCVELEWVEKCKYIIVVIIALSSSILLVTSVMFTTLAFKHIPVGHVSFLNIPVVCFAVGVGVLLRLYYFSKNEKDCKPYIDRVFHRFTIVYVIGIVYVLLFLIWLCLLVLWLLRVVCHLNLSQRFMLPLIRKGLLARRKK